MTVSDLKYILSNQRASVGHNRTNQSSFGTLLLALPSFLVALPYDCILALTIQSQANVRFRSKTSSTLKHAIDYSQKLPTNLHTSTRTVVSFIVSTESCHWTDC